MSTCFGPKKLVGSSPWALVCVGAALLGLLALNEWWGARLTWGRTP